MKNWRLRAFCSGANPEIFDDPWHGETAKEYCRRCAVRDECLAYALTQGKNLEGTWGGTTQAERSSLLRGGHRTSCPGCGDQNKYSDGQFEICVSCGLSWQI